jgi:hypothetical protein
MADLHIHLTAEEQERVRAMEARVLLAQKAHSRDQMQALGAFRVMPEIQYVEDVNFLLRMLGRRPLSELL